MHQNNDDRRRRIQSLSRKLQDIAAARLQLVQQLESLDTQAEQLHSERSMLKTLDTTISHLPDEVFAMIFEEGTLMKPSPMKYERWPIAKRRNADYSNQYFAVLVSHVARRWRNIALDTPRLWTDIRCIGVPRSCYPRTHYLYPKMMPIFLSRAKALPVDVTILGPGSNAMDMLDDLLQFMGAHIGHCRQLSVKDLSISALMALLYYASSRPIPLLNSIRFASSSRAVTISELQLFQRSTPRLTSVQLNHVDLLSMPLCLHAFNSVTSLRLTDFDNQGGGYVALRDSLMSLKSLNHLELVATYFDPVWKYTPNCFPIVLPTIQSLYLSVTEFSDTFNNLICSIHAPSLITLSLEDPIIPAVLEHHLPSMRHLLVSDMGFGGKSLVMLAQSFPDIEQLTFDSVRDVDNTFKTIFFDDTEDTEDGENTEVGEVGEDGGCVMVQWSNLQTIGVSGCTGHFNASKLQDLILRLQRAGCPIRKLLLPRTVTPEEGADGLVELEKLVEIDEFHLDWPTPFDWSKD